MTDVRYVDVASLRKLAAQMEIDANCTIFEAGQNEIEDYYSSLLTTRANAIYKVIEEAQKPDPQYLLPDGMTTLEFEAWMRELSKLTGVEYDDAHANGFRGKINNVIDGYRKVIEGAPESDFECKAAAKWVEANGGLSIVENRYVENALVKHDVCMVLGLDGVDGSVGYQSIFAELDKRLMPQGIEWPRLDDGERVRFGDEVEGKGKSSGIVSRVMLNRNGYQLRNSDDKDIAGWKAYSRSVKRPEPEVLGADGLPIKVGETVWFANSANATEFVVAEMSTDSEYSVRMRLPESPEQDGQWFLPQALTHTPPDTQERIDDDASMDPSTYCDEVLGWGAEKIVHHSDYAAQNKVMIADLLRRQRELDARKMGGE